MRVQCQSHVVPERLSSMKFVWKWVLSLQEKGCIIWTRYIFTVNRLLKGNVGMI